MSSVLKIIKNPFKIIWIMDRLKISRIFTDVLYIKLKYRAIFGKKLNLINPKTYNEKLQWLKLYDRKPLYTTLVDKYAVKQYIAEKIGEEYIIPTLGVWDRFDDIDFDKLPNRFVLKCTHDSGGLVICKDKSKLDIPAAKKKIEKSLKRNYYYVCREWPYKNIKPKIIAETFLENKMGQLPDYKFYCCNGEPKAMLIATDRSTDVKFDTYDMDFNYLPMITGHAHANKRPEKPQGFEKMKELARQLSQGFTHVRVDFYDVEGKVYFGEMTFSPCGGFKLFDPEEWDETFGSWIELPKK